MEKIIKELNKLEKYLINDSTITVKDARFISNSLVKIREEAMNYTHSSKKLPTEEEINIKASERAKQIAPTNATPLISHRISFRMGANFVKEHIRINTRQLPLA